MKTFDERCSGKKLICYGIGREFYRIIKNYAGYGWEDSLVYLVDGNPARQGEAVIVRDREYRIYSLDNFIQKGSPFYKDITDAVLLITCTAYEDVIEKLNQVPQLDHIECYPFHFMFGLSEGQKIEIRQTAAVQIPPVIHYCWFGRGKLPDLYKQCVESWHKCCPDYEIKEWNEDNCDIAETQFTHQAYQAGKYGFVPDYFRLKVIYENGGIYMDTDVEMLKCIDDLRYNEAFCGMEFPGEVALGLGFGAQKGCKIIRYLMERYAVMPFIYEDGSLNEVVSPVYQTQDLMKIGMKYGSGFQKVEGLSIYPIEVLSPKNVSTGEVIMTGYSYTLHHYDGSWVSGERLKRKKAKAAKIARIQKMFQ